MCCFVSNWLDTVANACATAGFTFYIMSSHPCITGTTGSLQGETLSDGLHLPAAIWHAITTCCRRALEQECTPSQLRSQCVWQDWGEWGRYQSCYHVTLRAQLAADTPPCFCTLEIKINQKALFNEADVFKPDFPLAASRPRPLSQWSGRTLCWAAVAAWAHSPPCLYF